jgi:uncharacterized protein YqgV (UPF0045/DUF77 family)
MIATIEISMYPLTGEYEQKIIAFIQRVKQHNDIRVEVGGMSTLLIGDYDLLMQVVKHEMQHEFVTGRAVFVFKIAGGERTKEKLPDALK